MKHFLNFLFLSTVMICWLFAPQVMSACVAENQINNASFEKASVIGNVGKYWKDNSDWADADVSYTHVQDSQHDSYHQRVSVGKIRSGAVQLVQPSIELVSGRTYEISISIRGQLSSALEVLLRKRGKPYSTYLSAAYRPVENWQEYRFRGVVTTSDTNAYFMIRTKGVGWFEIDHVKLVDVTDCVDHVTATKDNFVPNASFEAGLQPWGVLTRETDYTHMAEVRWDSPQPMLVEGLAPHGVSSLLLTVPQYGKVRLSTPYLRIPPGRPVYLSFYVRSSTPRQITYGLESGRYGHQVGIHDTARIGVEWQLVRHKGVLHPSREDGYIFFIESEGKGQLWLDAVHIEEAESRQALGSKFATRAPVEAGFSLSNHNGLYETSESAPLELLVYAPHKSVVRVGLWERNWDGRSRRLTTASVSISDTGHGRLELDLDTQQIGYKKIEARMGADESDPLLAEVSVGVIPPRPVEPSRSPFGAHAWFSPDGLNAAANLGIDWLRLHPPYVTKWAIVQPQQGEFRFVDAALRAAKRKYGFSLLGSLDATPQWASSAAGKKSKFRDHRAAAPISLHHWSNYVYQTVRHYRGIIDHWEVWNEPDLDTFFRGSEPFSFDRKASTYVEMLEAAYRSAKEANPNAIIVGGSSSAKDPMKWFSALASRGALQHMDVYSFHGYTGGKPADLNEVEIGRNIERMREVMRSNLNGEVLPIWDTESGVEYVDTQYDRFTEIPHGYPHPAMEVAGYIVRNSVALIELGVDRWFYYSARASHRADRNEFNALFEWDGTPRPSAVAYAVMTRLLNGFEYLSSSDHEEVRVVRFQDNGRYIDVVWGRPWPDYHLKQVELPAPLNCDTVDVKNIIGEHVEFQFDSQKVEITVESVPRYIFWSGCDY